MSRDFKWGEDLDTEADVFNSILARLSIHVALWMMPLSRVLNPFPHLDEEYPKKFLILYVPEEQSLNLVFLLIRFIYNE